MSKAETINGAVFLEQTTYYIYRSEEDRLNDKPMLTTSCKKTWNSYKKQFKQK